MDEWDEVVAKPTLEKPKEYLEFNTPPLALVIAMQEAGKDLTDIFTTLLGVGQRPHIKTKNVVNLEHQKHAAEIYNYFAKKHTMRRIKGEWISKYMLAVDDLCENRRKINKENVKVLITLPRIYNQNRALERVMKGRKSAKKIDISSSAAWRGEIEFVEKVHVKAGRTNEYQYFFSTPNNYLMRIVVKKGEYGSNAWDFVAAQGKVYIETQAVYTYAVKGYDFNVLQPLPESLEIKIV